MRNDFFYMRNEADSLLNHNKTTLYEIWT